MVGFDIHRSEHVAVSTAVSATAAVLGIGRGGER